MMKRGIVLTHFKRAQAAMEFLMTYGWALLVVLVAIGALAFFGVLNPGQFLPDQCVLFAGLSCTSAFADAAADLLKFTFQNGLGYTMTSFATDVLITGDTSTLVGIEDASPAITQCGINAATSSIKISDGKSQSCFFTKAMIQGEKPKGKLTIRWTDSSLNVRVKEGNFALTAEGP